MPEQKVTFFAYMPRANATARQRAYLIAEGLEAAGWSAEVVAPLRDTAYGRYVTPSNMWDRIAWLVEMLTRTLGAVLRFERGGIAVVQRELLPIGPPVLERMLRRKAGALILDVDDAIYATSRDRSHSALGRLLLSPRKFATVCRMADVVVCGNASLAAEASRFNRRTVVIPTSLAFSEAPARRLAEDGRTALGWLGNPGNLGTLAVLGEPLRRLRDEGHDIVLRVMSARRPSAQETDGIEAEFTPWSLEGEERFLAEIDAGVMPLSDDEYSRGKCGFKLLRYMAAGVPVLGSTVGVNDEIILDGQTGIAVRQPAEWYDAIRRLLEMSAEERQRMAQQAAEHVRRTYSLDTAVRGWIDVLEGVKR